MIQFESVCKKRRNVSILYELLKERTPNQSISHKKLPTFEDHRKFVESQPYFQWYLIKNEAKTSVGAVYLTMAREIGIFIFKEHQGKGYATESIKLLISMCPGQFLANINPKNKASIRLFEKLGAKHIQQTFLLK